MVFPTYGGATAGAYRPDADRMIVIPDEDRGWVVARDSRRGWVAAHVNYDGIVTQVVYPTTERDERLSYATWQRANNLALALARIYGR